MSQCSELGISCGGCGIGNILQHYGKNKSTDDGNGRAWV